MLDYFGVHHFLSSLIIIIVLILHLFILNLIYALGLYLDNFILRTFVAFLYFRVQAQFIRSVKFNGDHERCTFLCLEHTTFTQRHVKHRVVSDRVYKFIRFVYVLLLTKGM